MAGELVRMAEVSMSTPITLSAGDGAVEMSVDDVLKWVQPQAPPEEALKFLLVCRAHRVNPFLGEAHLIPMGGTWSVVVDKSGWLRKAEEHEQFDGIEAGITVQQYDQQSKARGEMRDIEGSALPPGHIVLGGWCRVWRKDRTRPSVARVSILEYKRSTPNWDKIPCTMIRKVAIVQALRESGLVSGGAYDAAEMPAVMPPPPEAYRGVPAENHAAIEAEVIEPVADFSLVNKLFRLKEGIGISDLQWRQILGRRGVDDAAELTDRQAVDLIGKLQAMLDQRDGGKTLLPDAASPEPAKKQEAEAEADDATEAKAEEDDAA